MWKHLPKLGLSSSLVLPLLYVFETPSLSCDAKKPTLSSMVTAIDCEDGSTVLPYEVPSRSTQVSRLRSEPFDVLVIGGGATGAGCALDAATRGLNVALVERSDFASGTSGRSTKLIHGGVRYLEQAFKKLDVSSLHLVNEALTERKYMLSAAPYMNRPLPIMIPLYTWWQVPYMYIGTKVYDMVAGKNRYVPPSYFISKTEALYQFPTLLADDLKGAIVYYDGQMNDTRMNLAIALTAVQSGAAVSNRIEVMYLLKNKEGKVCGAHVKDTMSGDDKGWDIMAQVVINATGPFADAVRHMDVPEAETIIVPAAGVHVVLPDHMSPDRMGLIIPETKDGRVLFFLPWENATLAGTTDSESELTMLPCPTEQEIDFILSEANRYVSRPIRRSDVSAAWSGIRPLAKDPATLGSPTATLSRNHVIEVSDAQLVTIAGGKWTTYRRMAQDTIDIACSFLKESQQKLPCCTHSVKMIGADRIGEVCGKKFDTITITLREKYNMDKDVAEHLMRNYGTRALQIAEIHNNGFDKNSRSCNHPKRLLAKYPYLEAEVIFAVRQEYAVKAVDVIARRTRLAFIDVKATESIVPRVVDLMGTLLNWSKARKKEEIAECEAFLKTMRNGVA